MFDQGGLNRELESSMYSKLEDNSYGRITYISWQFLKVENAEPGKK